MKSEKEIKNAIKTLESETPDYLYIGNSEQSLERTKLRSSYNNIVYLLQWVLGGDGDIPRPHDWS